MRRAIQAFIIGGALFSAAACGTAANPAPGEAGAGIGSAVAESGAAAPAGVDSSVRSSCEALGQVYSKNMAPFAEALTKLADTRKGSGDDKKDEQQVRQALVTFAAAISSATQSSTDPQIKSDGKAAAERIKKEAAGAELFAKVKTTEDVNTAVGSTLKDWLSPVDKHCS